MENKYAVRALSSSQLLIHRVPAQSLSRADALNLAAWLVVYGERLEGTESFMECLRQVRKEFKHGKSK